MILKLDNADGSERDGGQRRTFTDATDFRFFPRPFLDRLEEEKSDLAKDSLNMVVRTVVESISEQEERRG